MVYYLGNFTCPKEVEGGLRMNKDNSNTSINNRFKQVRLLLNMSQEEFGKNLGLSKSGISNIESGERGLRDTYINILCSKFNINSQWLRTGNGEMCLPNPEIMPNAFEEYIKSIGYSINTRASENNQLIELSKNGMHALFTRNEFENFQKSITESVDFQVWKQHDR